MILEEKQLLLKDLCGRLLYGVKGLRRGKVHELLAIDGRVVSYACIRVDGYDAWFSIDTFKPYLHPMSSMTKEEAIEMYFTVDDSRNVINCEVSKDKISFLLEHDGNYAGHRVLFFNDIYSLAQMDWLNKHHFDYRGLIPMELALEAPDGMYKED